MKPLFYLPKIILSIVFTLLLSTMTFAQTVVNSLAEFRLAVQNSNQDIVLESGNYYLEDLPSNSRVINCTGSGNTIDMTGARINTLVGSIDEVYFIISGDNNVLRNGAIEDFYKNGLEEVTNFSVYNNDRDDLANGLGGDPIMSITGNQNLVEGLEMIVKGSFPYGYGSQYGIGSSNTFGLNKRCGILITGSNGGGIGNTLDGITMYHYAFGHGIFMQTGATETTIKNCYIEGRLRLSDDMYNDTETYDLPYRTDYKFPTGDDYRTLPFIESYPIPYGQVYPLSEDGIRSYNSTGSVTVENCTVKQMRGGIRLYLASSATVSNSTAIDCGSGGTNFNMPNNGTITGSSGNFTFAPLNDHRLSRSGQNIEMTIIPSPNALGPHNIADILGNNHNIVFHRTPGPIDSDEERAIVVSGDNSTIVNETEYRIILESGASGNTITSCGPVTDNGSGNDVSSSNDCEIDTTTECSSYVSDITPPSNLVSGVSYNYYEGTWNTLPNFDSLTPIASGLTSNISLNATTTSADYFGYTFEGYLNVSNEGEYTFYTSSDDGSGLWINGNQVVYNDGLHGTVEKSGQVCLEAGYHKIEVEYFEKTGGNTLSVAYSGPGISKTNLSNLYAQDTSVSSVFPDPNKTYYIDAPYHNLRLSATGEAVAPTSVSINTTGTNVEWKFIAKGNGTWHIQRAAGGTMPRLRTDQNEEADMQPTSSSGDWTSFEFTEGAIVNTYFITLPNVSTEFKRLQIDNTGSVNMVGGNRNGTWESFAITEAGNNIITATDIRIEAEDHDGMSGIQTEGTTDVNGGENVGWVNNGDWLRFDDVNLSGLSNMDARIACNFSGGTIEVRTGSATGTLIGSISISNTGGNQNWITTNTPISNASGEQDVYLVFTGGSGYLFNVNWIEFNNSSTASKDVTASAEVSEVLIYPNPVSATTTIQNAADSTLNVYDMNGSVVFTKVISSESEIINLSGLTTGMYYGEVIGASSVAVMKIVKD